MKRIISLFLLALLLVGCTSQGAGASDEGLDSDYSQTDSDTDGAEPTDESTGGATDSAEAPSDTQPTEEATQAPEKKFKIKELIPDNGFLDGMTVLSQKDHANGDRVVELGEFRYGDLSKAPKWSLAQWDSGPCIWENRADSESNTLTDGVSKWVTYKPDEKSLLLRLNTEAYYQGKGAVKGDYWPHLLIEEDFGYSEATPEQKLYYSGAAESMRLSFDLRMPYYIAVSNRDDWVEAAQLYAYVTVKQKKDPEGRFVWFGMQLFDSRYERNATGWHIDGGKADASNQMIYLIGLSEVYPMGVGSLWGEDGAAPQASDRWVHIDVELIPHLRDMLSLAVEQGYFPDGTGMEDIYIDYMNYGWESIATYDSAAEIKNLRLDSRLLGE